MQTKNYYTEKIVAKLKAWIGRLNDVGFVGQMVFVVIVLLISWSGIKTIQTNYGLQKQISALKQQNDLQKLQNSNQTLKNEYYNSSQYLELAARQSFSLAAPGEKEVIVPPEVALAYTVDVPEPTQPRAASSKPPAYQRNIEAWRDFFLHRQDTAR